jgi:hypothetical protein
MQDKNMTTDQKIDKLTTIRTAFRNPPLTSKTEFRDGPNINFGCGDSNSSPVNYAAPPGFHIMSANASVVASDKAKSVFAKVTSQTPTSASAVAYFQGMDRDWTGNCPGGGHGAARITVDIAQN